MWGGKWVLSEVPLRSTPLFPTVCAYPDPGCLQSVRNKPSQHTVTDAHSDSLVGVWYAIYTSLRSPELQPATVSDLFSCLLHKGNMYKLQQLYHNINRNSVGIFSISETFPVWLETLHEYEYFLNSSGPFLIWRVAVGSRVLVSTHKLRHKIFWDVLSHAAC